MRNFIFVFSAVTGQLQKPRQKWDLRYLLTPESDELLTFENCPM